jgi:hypothetical protein
MGKPYSEDLRRSVVEGIVSSCLKVFSPRECDAYLANTGYGQPNRKTL